MAKSEKQKKTNISEKGFAKNEAEWINPVGGYGDILMLSGVLKLAFDQDPSKQYKLVRRTKYSNLLKGHPALSEIGFPPKEAKFVNTNYWDTPDFATGKHRAFQLLAQCFGLKTPVEEKLFLAGLEEGDSVLEKIIPWKKKNILISPSSDSPRKMMHPMVWHKIVERLTAEGALVIQAGNKNDVHIKGAYSLLNLTTPRQLISLIKKCNFVISSDNFIMHAAHLVGIPAVVLWGPTSSKVYGYDDQIHLQSDIRFCPQKNNCLGPGLSMNYPTICPLGNEHCMNKISLDQIFYSIFTLL